MGAISILLLGCLVLFPGPNSAEKTADHEATALQDDTSLIERNERSLLEILAGGDEDQSLDSGIDHRQIREKRNGNIQVVNGGVSRKRRAVGLFAAGALKLGRAFVAKGRKAGGVLLENAGNLNDVLDLILNIFGLFGGSEEVSNEDLHEMLVKMDKKLDSITEEIKDMRLDQEYYSIVGRYNDDEKLLRNFADDLQDVNNDGIYTGYHENWPDVVLDPGEGGVSQALRNIQTMVMGTSLHRSLFEVLFQRMKGNWQEEFHQISENMALFLSLQTAGYSACMAALKTKGDSDEFDRVHRDSAAKMNEQLQFLQQYLPYDCPDDYTLYNDSCYKVTKDSQTHDEASKTCKRQGPRGRLAMAKDENTNDFLTGLKNNACENCEYHFGLDDIEEEDEWKWADGSDLGSYDDWADDEPNNGGWWCWGCPAQDCAVFKKGTSGNKWDDIQCSKSRYFICQTAPSQTACENEILHLRCPPGKEIDVISARYGCKHNSREENPCKHLDSSVGYCHAGGFGGSWWGLPKDLKIVREECDNKENCMVSASNEVFGDPLPGKHKYLKVEYTCVE